MGQKVNPTGFRTGITEPWKSRWYAPKKEFRGLLLEDFKVRQFMKKKYRSAAIAKVEIERTRDEVNDGRLKTHVNPLCFVPSGDLQRGPGFPGQC